MKSFAHSKTTALMVFSLLILSFCTVHAEKIAFYVSPQGNDSWAGDSIDRSFASIQKARDAIRAIKRQAGLANPVIVYIRGGLYELSEPLLFTVEDSGTESCPVTYTACTNDISIISGGGALRGEKRRACLAT